MNTLSTNIGLDDPETMKLSDDMNYAHLYLTTDTVVVLRTKEAASKLAELALHCYARLVLKEQSAKDTEVKSTS